MSMMTTADLPESMQSSAPVEALTTKTAPTAVLTCQHGPACPACVLAAARMIVEHDATLVGEVYTG